MRTVKVVVIGASGVGKTSIRGQYISGRFSTGYRATIGADFISKTLPHYNNPDESVTLQLWDTAGQERFSSLSSAFFRGADAAILVFDVNHPQTLEALRKWWDEFKEKAPLHDEDAEDYCCVFVGNKVDLVNGSANSVSEMDALRFMDEIIPPSSCVTSPTVQEDAGGDDFVLLSPGDNPLSDEIHLPVPNGNAHTGASHRTDSIDINPHIPTHHHFHHLASKSRSRSRSKFLSGTVTTTHTTLTIYHTPSSSLFDTYESARSSPAPRTPPSHPASRSVSVSPSRDPDPQTHSPRRMSSLSISTTSSGPTITPSLFSRPQLRDTSNQNQDRSGVVPVPLPPEKRPKLFFTSAKTGEGVSDVFDYIARRVVRRWEYEEAVESRVMHFREPSDAATTIRLHDDDGGGGRGVIKSCCSF